MPEVTYPPHTVLTIGGHDPGGGAGIQADLEAIGANGCHAASAITCLTVQDSCNLSSLGLVLPESVLAQARAVLSDQRVTAIKIGLLGSAALIDPLAELLLMHRDIPVVLDPVLAAGGGTDLATESLINKLKSRLLPLSTLITPNRLEAERLCGGAHPSDELAALLVRLGAGAVLITGGHDGGAQVTNRLYDRTGLLDASAWPRLDGEYHGSGCTLAAAIATGLAKGSPLLEAVRTAQQYTWQTLATAYRNGRCQATPDRLFGLRGNQPA